MNPTFNATTYKYNLDEIPAAHRALFAELNKAIDKAAKKHRGGDYSLTRHNNGYIVVNSRGELIEIFQYTQDAPDGLQGWWMAREYKDRWYADPRPLLHDLKTSLDLDGTALKETDDHA